MQARARVATGAATETETMLGYTTIVAPFDGVITRKLADVGDLATPGKPLANGKSHHAAARSRRARGAHRQREARRQVPRALIAVP